MNCVPPRLGEGTNGDGSLESSIFLFIKSNEFFSAIGGKVLHFHENINPKSFFALVFQEIFLDGIGKVECEVFVLVVEVDGGDNVFRIEMFLQQD